MRIEREEELSEDGTLTVHVSDGSKVNRVLVMGENIFGGLYYPDSAENKEELISKQAIEEINSEIPQIHELIDIAYEYNKEDSTRTELSQKCTTYLLGVWQTLGAIVDNCGADMRESKGEKGTNDK